ncbi:hypothetical protein [Pseudoalteromonas sp.]|uniref:hypothetical protein n=1 Tax=Pseudoalteromonas sp. TaxID=53249 RepID=UPI0035699323
MNEHTLKSIPNLALFQRVTCQVLNQLQHYFPTPCDVSATQLGQQMIDELNLVNLLPLDLAIEISAVISWLEKAELIWVGGHELNDFFDVTLSKYTLSLLIDECSGVRLSEQLYKAQTDDEQHTIIKKLLL